MRRRWHLLHDLRSRLLAALWVAVGRRALVRGDVAGAREALRRAVAWRPGAFRALLHLARAHVRGGEVEEACRVLARAREADPHRYAREVARALAREGTDLDRLAAAAAAAGAAPGAAAPRLAPTAVRRAGTARGVATLPWGDARDLDEYARLHALPPISRAERETTDWDAVLGALLDD